ncbi:zinc finger and SCAN domain-containing protein 22 isoform X2 [Puma concolor]|uniref:Zinc finger and SCAN domain-containing protein 22 isoform X2 n=1 Tax=Puma concolor TaxID=9696 RepID=A0A6P6H4K4_PUMCO|nr:zinc finger and SCAN domain-containing protein 22 isoform X2 [Puma concolor]
MAIPKSPLSPMPWEQDGFLRVKVEDEEASLSEVQESSPGHTVHPEAARLRFRRFCYEEASNPHEALAQLRELCHQWLQPEAHSKEQMLELLVLEQFLGALPPKIQSWVGAQFPKSGEEAAMLVEGLTRNQELSSQSQAASRMIWKSPSHWVGPLKPSREVVPWDLPLMMLVNLRAAQRGRQDSQGKSGQSLSPKRWIAGKLQSLTRMFPQTRPAVNLVPWGIVPTCGQISSHKRRHQKRNLIHWMVMGWSRHVYTQGRSLPSVVNVGKHSRAPPPSKHTRRAIFGRHPTPVVSVGKPLAGALTWPSTKSSTRGQSPMSVKSAGRPSAGSPT